MGWREELAGKVGKMTEADWEQSSYVVPTGHGGRENLLVAERRTFTVTAGDTPDAVLLPLLNRVNGDAVAGLAPGRLLLAAYRHDERRGCHLTFVLSRRDWNTLLHPDGEWRPLAGEDGSLPFPYGDFSVIPD